MTDDEQFTALFADYPDGASMHRLHDRVAGLYGRIMMRRGDGTIDKDTLARMKRLRAATQALAEAIVIVETNASPYDPDDDIPF